MTDTDLTIVLGTRPEIIKLAPVIRECDRRDLSYTIIHTGQHYSENLDAVFFDQLNLPTPEYNLAIGSGSHGKQTGAMIQGIEEVLLDEQPETVLVQGDTNSVLAGAIATGKLDAELGHVEAGLRSYDRSMPEEMNRVLADHAADYLFAPTDYAAAQLRRENISDDQIIITGNTVVDALYENRELATQNSTILSDLGLSEFGLLTAHRAKNVDDPDRFAEILDGVYQVATTLGLDIVYPAHPRAKNILDQFDLTVPDPIQIVDPLDYLDFLAIESQAQLVLTDSGGVQEEACILGVPCVTLRDNTERPETIDVGANRLVGTQPSDIVEGAQAMSDIEANWEQPFGDGTAAIQILDTVVETGSQEGTK